MATIAEVKASQSKPRSILKVENRRKMDALEKMVAADVISKRELREIKNYIKNLHRQGSYEVHHHRLDLVDHYIDLAAGSVIGWTKAGKKLKANAKAGIAEYKVRKAQSLRELRERAAVHAKSNRLDHQYLAKLMAKHPEETEALFDRYERKA